MIGIVAYLVIVGALLALAAHSLDALLRIAGRPTRWGWAGSLVLMVVLAGSLVLRNVRAHPPAARHAPTVAASTAGAHAATIGPVLGVASLVAAANDALEGAVQRLVRGASSRVPAAGWAFGVLWGATSFALLVLLAVAYQRFRRAVLKLPRAVVHGEAVRVSPRLGPAVVGVARPVVVVPRWLLEASEEEQRLAVAHEREHLRALDPLLLIAGCVAAALVPWHPVAWWMLARLRLAVEVDCDARVVGRGVAARAYGTALIELAARCARHPMAVPALTERGTQLERRLVALTPGPVRFRGARSLGLAALALFGVAAACEARLPTTPGAARSGGGAPAAVVTRGAAVALVRRAGDDQSLAMKVSRRGALLRSIGVARGQRGTVSMTGDGGAATGVVAATLTEQDGVLTFTTDAGSPWLELYVYPSAASSEPLLWASGSREVSVVREAGRLQVHAR